MQNFGFRGHPVFRFGPQDPPQTALPMPTNGLPIAQPLMIGMLFGFLAGGCGLRTPESDVIKRYAQGSQAKRSAVEDGDGDTATEMPDATERAEYVERVRPQVEKFCGDCHAMPRPASSSRAEWPDEVNQGFMLYGTSGRSDLEVPPYDEVLNFFQYQAPEELTLPKSIQGYPPTTMPLRPTAVRLPGNRLPGVTNVRWIDIGLKSSPALVYCDIGTGALKAHWPQEEGGPTERLATLLQPVHVEPCDADGDGLIDLVVADIGEFNADDSDLGRVVLLRRKPDSEKFESIVLAENLSRVADVQPGDFDGDGDQDFMVAVFGWRKTGRILMLENNLDKGGSDDGGFEFTVREIDERHGPVHVPPIDLNGDGHLDFIALISQDHEVVEAFINDGKANFSTEVLWAAPDPAYGSSGIELVDLDQDGDMDVLYTNGDSFDRGPKPHHSVQWLENQGAYPYVHHHLCEMPGVLNATAADFDGDGDIDVVAGSLLGDDVIEKLKSIDTSSVVMLEQTSPGEFKRTKVESGTHDHISIEAGDFNNDGKIDFAVGNFLRERGSDQPDLMIWWAK